MHVFYSSYTVGRDSLGDFNIVFFLPVPHLDSEDMTAMAELPFVKADVREIFESKFHAVSG